MTVKVAKDLKTHYASYQTSLGSGIGIDQMRANLQDYYRLKFGAEYRRLNPGKSFSSNNIISQLNDNSIFCDLATSDLSEVAKRSLAPHQLLRHQQPCALSRPSG